jgi:hypothetical protein
LNLRKPPCRSARSWSRNLPASTSWVPGL